MSEHAANVTPAVNPELQVQSSSSNRFVAVIGNTLGRLASSRPMSYRTSFCTGTSVMVCSQVIAPTIASIASLGGATLAVFTVNRLFDK